MSNPLDLKQIERRAFRSIYQDGLTDILVGLIVVSMAIFLYRPPEGYSSQNIVLMLLGMVLAQILFQLGKYFITRPRLGRVTFGEVRRSKRTSLAIVMGVVVLIQAGVVGLTALGSVIPQVGAWLANLFPSINTERLAVAAVGSLFVAGGMIVLAYFGDFLRGYILAMLMSLAVGLMIYTNQPLIPILIGVTIILIGLFFLVRFLRQHPLPRQEEPHE